MRLSQRLFLFFWLHISSQWPWRDAGSACLPVASAMTMAEFEGFQSYQKYPGVAYISGTALDSPRRQGYCTGVFVAPEIVLTAGRCLTGVNEFGLAIDTADDGEYAMPGSTHNTYFGNMRVGIGPFTPPNNEPAVVDLGPVSNYSFVYQSGKHGFNLGILRVNLRDPSLQPEVYPPRN